MEVTTANQSFTLPAGTFLLFLDRPVVLAFNLNEFNASLAAGNVELGWKVGNEQYVNGYEVERSFDGTNFELIAKRDGRTGMPGAATGTYTFKDGNRAVVYGSQPVFYRLRIKDLNGESLYSNTVIVDPSKDWSKKHSTHEKLFNNQPLK
jgi:hypothetical protein